MPYDPATVRSLNKNKRRRVSSSSHLAQPLLNHNRRRLAVQSTSDDSTVPDRIAVPVVGQVSSGPGASARDHIRWTACVNSSPCTNKQRLGPDCARPIASCGSGWPGCGPAGGSLSSSCHPTPSCGGSGAASASTGPSSPPGPSQAVHLSMPRSQLPRLGTDVSERTVCPGSCRSGAPPDPANIPRQPCPRRPLRTTGGCAPARPAPARCFGDAPSAPIHFAASRSPPTPLWVAPFASPFFLYRRT